MQKINLSVLKALRALLVVWHRSISPTAYFGARDRRCRRNVITCFGWKMTASFG